MAPYQSEQDPLGLLEETDDDGLIFCVNCGAAPDYGLCTLRECPNCEAAVCTDCDDHWCDADGGRS